MTPTPAQPDYLVRLRALPRSGPVANRLRMFLKSALRAWGLRAVSIVELPVEKPARVVAAEDKPA